MTRNIICRTVEHYYNTFHAALSMFGNGKPYPLDIASTLWVDLVPFSRETAEAESYRLPAVVESTTIEQALSSVEKSM